VRFLCLLVRPTLALLSSAFICSPVLARHPQSRLVKVKCERTVSHLDGKISANYYKEWVSGAHGAAQFPVYFKPTGNSLVTRSYLVWEEGYCYY